MIMKHSDRIVGIRQLLLGANAQAQSEGCVVGNSLNGLATALIANIGSQKGAGPAREKRLNGKAGRFLLMIAVLSGRYLLTCGPPRLVACAGWREAPGLPRTTAENRGELTQSCQFPALRYRCGHSCPCLWQNDLHDAGAIRDAPSLVQAQMISIGVTGGIPISPHSQNYGPGMPFYAQHTRFRQPATCGLGPFLGQAVRRRRQRWPSICSGRSGSKPACSTNNFMKTSAYYQPAQNQIVLIVSYTPSLEMDCAVPPVNAFARFAWCGQLGCSLKLDANRSTAIPSRTPNSVTGEHDRTIIGAHLCRHALYRPTDPYRGYEGSNVAAGADHARHLAWRSSRRNRSAGRSNW